MFIILGATGHIGGAAARALLEAGEPVTAVVHDTAHAPALAAHGATIAAVDVREADALRTVFRTGRRALLVNPPADPKGDFDADEHATASGIVAALDGSGLEAVVAASTYGAQPGEGIGDLSSLYGFEQALHAQPIPVRIHRGAYYYTNWDAMLDGARAGAIRTPFPAGLVLPMVDPADLGRIAAARLRDFAPGLANVEGPRRYAIREVASIFAEMLGHEVTVDTVPRDGIEAMYAALGFSPVAVRSFTRMTLASLAIDAPEPDERCPTTLEQHLRALVG